MARTRPGIRVHLSMSYVYMIGAYETPDRIAAVKIGFTGNVECRIKNMQTHCWLPLKVLGIKEFENRPLAAVNFESFAHLHLQKFRLRGEWFDWSAEVNSFLREYMTVMDDV